MVTAVKEKPKNSRKKENIVVERTSLCREIFPENI
jgi:hypothetical protein